MSAREQTEYKQMRLFNIFSDEEILKIHKARKIFESRIVQPDKELRDYLEYIKHERKLISESKERIKKRNIMEENTVAPLIALHIKQLYSDALVEFPKNLRFWDEYIKFLQQFKFYTDISEAFSRMLKIHKDKPEVWSRAIQWEHHENYEENRFKDLMEQAQEIHPDSLSLYLTLFQVELEDKRKRDVNTAIEHAEEVYATGKKKFPKIEFYIEMLKIVDKLSYARPVQQTILEDMRYKFSRDEIMWQTLAQRELHGLTLNESHSNGNDEIKQEDEDSKSSYTQSSDHSVSLKPMRKRIESCLRTYIKAIEHVDTEKMWSYFLNCMLELNKDLATQSSMKKYALNEAFRLANEKSVHMNEEHYTKYINLLYADNPASETIENVLLKATTIHKTSCILWLQRFRYFAQKMNFAKLKDIFYQARALLGTNGAEMWRWYFLYLKSHRTPHGEFDRFVTELSNQPDSAFNLVKLETIEMLENSTNIHKACAVCELFVRNTPDCTELEERKRNLEAKKSVEFSVGESSGSDKHGINRSLHRMNGRNGKTRKK